MIGIGYERYSKLSKAEKEKISELIGTIGGGTLGFGSITAGALGYGIIKGIKYLISGAVLNSNEIDEKWEILLDIEE